ncbi:MAG: APC family permease [Eubacteriales bacterium]|nr:APC family permease [Eubacteriales bacterium]
MNDLNKDTALKRSLSLPLLVMFGLAYLAPTVVFNYYGIFTQSTGGMYTLAFAITTVVMLFTSFSYVQMVKAYPVAGSAYTYVNKSVQPHIGFLTGWVMLLDYLLLPMICYLLLGIYINEFFPVLPIWAIVITVAALSALINIIGMKTASIIDTTIITAQIGFTLLLIIVIAKYVSGGGGAADLSVGKAIYNPETFDLGNVLTASAVLCVSFVGFDAVSTMAEEAKNPDKIMGKAIMSVIIGAGILFMVTSYFTQLAWPMAYAELEDVDSGIFELFPQIGEDWLGNVFFITDNFASFICAMAGMAAVSRILLGMGRDNILPKKFFGRISPRFQTPVNNILLTSVIALTALFYQDNLFGAASLISFGAVIGFFMVNLSVIFHYYLKLKMRGGKNTITYLISPGIGMLTLIVVFVNIESSAKILGSVWLVIGVVYLAIKTKGFKTLPPEMSLEEQ